MNCRRLIASIALLPAALALSPAGRTAPLPGEPAPDFTGRTAAGEAIALADFRGVPVVLEWTSHRCPFVAKHYRTGNMQRLQRRLTEAGAVWISVITAAPDTPGHAEAAEAQRIATRNASYADHILLDPDGSVGRAYDARTSPQMALIRPDGALAYIGAIDDAPSPRPESVDGAHNYLLAAFRALRAGDPADPAVTRAYGCAITY